MDRPDRSGAARRHVNRRRNEAPPSVGRRVLRSLGIIALITTLYYAAPVPRGPTDYVRIFGTMLLALAGLGFLVWLVRRRVAEFRQTSRPRTVGLEALVNALLFLAVLFAAAYFALAHAEGQIAGIATKTDALYFSMTTLATVGYGDIVATGQLARIVATVQMLFDIVFVGSVIGLVGSVPARPPP